MIALSSQSIDSLRRVRSAEQEIERASQFFDAVALWPRSDLDRHLGERIQGPWRLIINRPLPTLYIVTLKDSTGGRALLTTALYRAEVDRATP